MKFHNKIILIIGSAKAISRDVVFSLAKERVNNTFVDVKRILTQTVNKIETLRRRVTIFIAGISKSAENIFSRFGVMINNADEYIKYHRSDNKILTIFL